MTLPMQYVKNKNQNGQALITLIFFVMIATIYISAAVVILMVNSLAATRTEQGVYTARFAEGALEDTFLRLLRDPSYAGGSFNLDDGSVTVNVVNTDGTRDIDVTFTRGEYQKKYQARVQFVETEMTILSWKEVY